MKKRKLLSIMAAGIMAVSVLGGCGSDSSGSAGSSTSSGTENAQSAQSDTSGEAGNVLRVGMECAYAPFNWTQDSETTADGTTAVPIYGSDYYAYGYDVAVAQMLAEDGN